MFLDARHQRYLEEGSSCNLFFVLSDGRLVTPELGDMVLAGITRRTVIELAAERGIPVEEREQVFGDGAIGPVAHAFRSRLKGVQYGALEDRYGWMVPVARRTARGTLPERRPRRWRRRVLRRPRAPRPGARRWPARRAAERAASERHSEHEEAGVRPGAGAQFQRHPLTHTDREAVLTIRATQTCPNRVVSQLPRQRLSRISGRPSARR